jgi:YVTN family beta-propeller protein
MRTGLGRQPSQVRDLLLKSTFWMIAFVTALALSGAQGVAQTFGYVTNLDDGTVSVINTITNTSVGSPITVGNGPSSIAVTPDGAHVYVLNAFDNTVSVIATATNAVVGSPIPVGTSVSHCSVTVCVWGGIAITPSGSSVYVANSGDGTVSVIATASNTVVKTIPVVGRTNIPTGIAITPDGAYAYVADFDLNFVSVIATASNTVVGSPIPVGEVPWGVAITPDGTRAYVANAGDGTIDVIEIATNTVVHTITLGVGSQGVGPVAVAITPDGTHAYVLSPLDTNVETVSVIATANNTVVGSPITVGPASDLIFPTIGITPDGTGVYVPIPGTNTGAANNTVSVISTASNTVTATVRVGNAPIGVALTPAIFFSAFSTKLDISSAGFDLKGTFTLGTGGSINPPTQPLSLQVGTYTVTIPVGSFKAGPKGTFTFEGTIGGVALQIRLAPVKASTYSIQVDASGVNLTGLGNTVAVTLSIGINRGTTSVTAQSN